MATNSSFFNLSLLFNNFSHPFLCHESPMGHSIYASFTVANLLLLPLPVLILVLGCRRWKQKRAASHSDHFTYHLAAMECITTFCCLMYTVAFHYKMLALMYVSLCIFSPVWFTKVHFNTFASVECYLAVVHPITYLGLKKKGGVQIQNICIGCLWLLCFLGTGVSFTREEVQIALFIISVVVALIIVSFCSLSVLCVLIRPGPAKEKVDQSKKRAFQTVVLILGVLFFGTAGMIVCEVVNLTASISDIDRCAILTSAIWFSLPSSLVLPLLFCHRIRKQQC